MKTLTPIFYLILTAFLFSNCNSDFSGNYNNDFQTEDNYNEVQENPFINVADENTSTFSIDADGASYSNIRRYIMQDQQLPPKNAVRIEEMINYFDLDYENNTTDPFSMNGEVSSCPWKENHKLIRIGIKGKHIPEDELPASNFVFLIDVSGSMKSSDKIGLLKEGLKIFTDGLTPEDKVAIVSYAGNVSVVLESTFGNKKDDIKKAIDKLKVGGGTNGGAAMEMAYEIAKQNFIEDGNNRIIMGTDGDFNVGKTGESDLVTFVEEKRDEGIYLSILGFGRGNLHDGKMEQIADNGNGTYEYIDNEDQIFKVFVHEKSKLFTVANDCKVQVKFNKNNVEAYRLIGYSNRVLNNEDFEDDKKDAGELGADQNVTALYEIIPVYNPDYKQEQTFTIHFRYILPGTENSIPTSLKIFDEGKNFNASSSYMKFTSSVTAFGMQLINSKYKGETTYSSILSWLDESSGLEDKYGYKEELKTIIKQAEKY